MQSSIMTSPRYYDVTHFLTDPNEICTAYIKFEIKGILFTRVFRFSEYLLIKLRLITKIMSIVQGPHTQNSLTYVDLSAKSSTFVSWAQLKLLYSKKIEFDLRSP